MNCPKCNSNSNMKDGFCRGEQRYICKDCKFIFTASTDLSKLHPSTKPKEYKQLWETLSSEGLGMNAIVRAIETTFGERISATTLSNWSKKKLKQSKETT